MTGIRPSPGADRRWMARCLHLARRSLGSSWPNPPVACILVRDNCPAASGRTASGGRPHAEAVALEAAGLLARGATAYVSLEPCAHHGQTPPCADALVDAGISRCVVSMLDPDPRVSGRGVETLRGRGVRVEVGLLEDAAQELLAGHASRVKGRRPWLTLKVAATLDGAVGSAGRKRLSVTGQQSRAFVEMLRGEHDAILIGAGTALADDPLLIPLNRGLARLAPVRIVFDTHLRLPADSRLALSAGTVPLWIAHGPTAPVQARRVLGSLGARLLEVPAQTDGRLSLGSAMERLAAHGITRILSEAGPRLGTAMLKGGLADEVIWLASGRLLGRTGLPAMEADLDRELVFRRSIQLGNDTATVWNFGP